MVAALVAAPGPAVRFVSSAGSGVLVQARACVTRLGRVRLERVLLFVSIWQWVFVTLPYYTQGVHRTAMEDLWWNRTPYSFFGDFGFGVALVLVTFGYSFLPMSVVVVFVQAVRQRAARRALEASLASVPWLLVLPFRERLVHWLWI